jgi:hypothetical protein
VKKHTAFFLIVLIAFFAAVVYAAAPPDKVILDKNGLKGPVYFDHKAHTSRAASCQECHHKNAPGTEQKCSACHQGAKLKDAYHTTCKGCHKEKGGPTRCDSCHTKK